MEKHNDTKKDWIDRQMDGQKNRQLNRQINSIVRKLKHLFQVNEKADKKNVGDTQIEEIIDEENVPKIMEAQIQSKELQIQSK